MKENIVTFQVAKLAKEKGFDWNCNNYTSKRDGDYFSSTNVLVGYKNWNEIHETWSRPTQSLLQKWIREVHGIDVIALPTSSSKYIFRLYQKGKTCKNQIYGAYMSKEYANYEEALGKGLQESLKLI